MMEQPSFGFAEEEPEATTFSVVELNSRVRDSLRRAFADEVWVRGEVQNLSRSSAGHTYFSLVEKAGRGDRVQGRLDVALFRDDRRAVTRALAEVPGAELGNDVEVRIRGRVTVYPPTGRYQLVMTGIDPVFTVGGIAANRERVLRALAAEGLLELNAGLELAPVPLRVGFDHQLRERGVPRLRPRAGGERLRVAGHRGRRAGAGRRRGASHQVGARSVVAARSRRRRARPRWRIAHRPRRLRHRAGGARDRRHAGAGHHRRRARDRPQRRRRGRVPRVQDPHGLPRSSCRRASPTSWPGSTTRRSGSRPVPVNAWRSPHASSTTPGAGRGGVRRPRWRANWRASSGAHGRADELARRRTGEVARQLDGCAARVAELGRRATRQRTRVARRTPTRARHPRRSPVAAGVAPARVARGRRRARSIRVGCWSAAIRSPATARGAWSRQATASLVGAILDTELATGRITSRVETITEEPGE